MIMKILKGILSIFILAVLVSCCAGDGDYADYDADNDDMLNNDEFSTALNVIMSPGTMIYYNK